MLEIFTGGAISSVVFYRCLFGKSELACARARSRCTSMVASVATFEISVPGCSPTNIIIDADMRKHPDVRSCFSLAR